MKDKSITDSSDIEIQVQNILSDYGTDFDTIVENLKRKIANRELSKATMDEILPKRKPKYLIEEMGGIYRGLIWVADDFDAPLDFVTDTFDDDSI